MELNMTRFIHYIYFITVVIVTINADDFNITNNTQPLSLPSVTVSWYPSVDNKVTTTVFYKKVESPTYAQKTLPQSNELKLDNLDFNVEYNVFVQTLMSSGNKKNSTTKMFRTRKAPKPLVVSDERMQVIMVRQENIMFYRIYVQKVTNANDGVEDLRPTNTLQLDLTDNSDPDIYVTYHGEQFNEKIKNLVIGDNTKTPYKNQEITNRALKPDTRYSFFQRNFINENNFTSNDWMGIITTDKTPKPNGGGKPVELDDDKIDETDIAIITVSVAIGVVAIIFVMMCICHYKFSMKYAPKAKPKRNQDTTQRMSTHPSIPVTELDFYDHVSQMKFHNFKGFYDEFALLRKTDMKISEEFRKPINVGKNRYLNKPLGKLSRVTLEGGDPYIYANYVPGTDSDQDYIFTQNPLPETVKDFWTMVVQKDVHNIVMIGEFTEKGEQICAKYFPDLDDEDFQIPAGKVTLFQIHSTADYHIRTLNFTTPNQETRIIKHFQFISWPSIRLVPEVVTPFLSFINVIERSRKTQGLNGPIIVHGSTAADRAGIYMCIDSQIRRVEDQTDVNVFNQVSDLKERIFDGIKTLDEYIFIHDGILEFILKRKIKNIPVQKLPEYVENVSKAADNPFTLEYTFLTSLSTTLKMDAGIQVYNKDKNRYQNIKPYDTNRVKLSKIPNKDGSDYINASWIDTYLRKRAFIASQAPLVETLADFWRMISENESWVIIMLGQEIENGQLKADRFWPIEGNVMAFGDLTVKLLCVQQGSIPDVIVRQIEMLNSKSGTSKLIQFYQYITWPSHEGISSESIHSLVRLVHLSDTWELKLKAKTVTIVTSSGIGRSGVLIALRSLQEESEVEGSVNIFRTVQRLRQQRAALVQTKEEYILIYTSAMEISQNVRRRSILNESFSDLTSPGVDIIPNGFSISRNGSIVGKLQSTPSVSEASQF